MHEAPPTLAEPHPIPDTDPQSVEKLWANVEETKMAQRGIVPIRGGRARRSVGTSRNSDAESSASASVSRDTYGLHESQTTRESSLANTSRAVSPRNPKFADRVLRPRRISVNDTNSIVPSAYAHFDTEQPHDGCDIDYDKLDGLSGARIWVSMDQATVESTAAEYKEMRSLALCEEEFATFAKETFFRGALRSARVSEDRCWRAERMLHLVCPPKENAHWRVPPLLDCDRAGEADWSWDVRPDCGYWLSLKGFNPAYRFQIQNCTFVRDWITCPYFTIEFKRTGFSEDTAVVQVVSAGALALYNRHRLRNEALKVSRASWGTEEISDIRHYALTFVGPKFVFWILQPCVDGSGAWNGCKMTRLCGADCTDAYGVRELISWTNEIHRWGLSKHGPACARDIKVILRGGGVRTSDIQAAS